MTNTSPATFRKVIRQKMFNIKDRYLVTGGAARSLVSGMLATFASNGIEPCFWNFVAAMGGIPFWVMPEAVLCNRYCGPEPDTLNDDASRRTADCAPLDTRLYRVGRSIETSPRHGPDLGSRPEESDRLSSGIRKGRLPRTCQ